MPLSGENWRGGGGEKKGKERINGWKEERKEGMKKGKRIEGSKIGGMEEKKEGKWGEGRKEEERKEEKKRAGKMERGKKRKESKKEKNKTIRESQILTSSLGDLCIKYLTMVFAGFCTKNLNYFFPPTGVLFLNFLVLLFPQV